MNKALKKRLDLIHSRGFRIQNQMKEVTVKLVKEYSLTTNHTNAKDDNNNESSSYGKIERVEIEFEAQEIKEEEEEDLMRVFDVCIYSSQRHPILRNPLLDATSTPPSSDSSSYLVISCTFAPKYKQISVRHVPVSETVTSPLVYDGPHLFDLPKNIQVRE